MEEELNKKLKDLQERLKKSKDEHSESIEFALAEIYDLYNTLIIKGVIVPNPKLKK